MLIMKDSILKLKDDKEYYVLEEIIYDNRNFVLAVECNLEKDEIKEDYLIMMEIKIINDNLVVDEINDDVLADKVAMAFKVKYQNN